MKEGWMKNDDGCKMNNEGWWFQAVEGFCRQTGGLKIWCLDFCLKRFYKHFSISKSEPLKKSVDNKNTLSFSVINLRLRLYWNTFMKHDISRIKKFGNSNY